MSEQVVNAILTTLAAAITTTAQTTGIQITALPAGLTSGRILFNGNGAEVILFSGVTGTGPYTLTGVTWAAEGTASTYAIGTQVVAGAITAGSLLANFLQPSLSTSNSGANRLFSGTSYLYSSANGFRFNNSSNQPLLTVGVGGTGANTHSNQLDDGIGNMGIAGTISWDTFTSSIGSDGAGGLQIIDSMANTYVFNGGQVIVNGTPLS